MSKIIIHLPEQYKHELHAWERALDFYKQENAFLKMYLSEMIDKYNELVFVEYAEYFNNKFIFTDEYILALQQDVRLQSQMLLQHINGDYSQDMLMNKLQLRLKNKMKKFEKGIADLKEEFNKKIAEILKLS